MKHNGFEYIDLGLPSGTKWAKCNVGAESETDYGLHFAWGDTKGYYNVTNSNRFTSEDYKFSLDGSSSKFIKYNMIDGKTILDLEDDAAYVNMGGRWHIPSINQIEELISNTKVTWEYDYKGSDSSGMLFTSNINSEKIFIPASGYLGNGRIGGLDDFGYIWSNYHKLSTVDNGYYMRRHADLSGVSYRSRYYGLSVRGVFNTFWIK